MGSVTLAANLAAIIGENQHVKAEVVRAGQKILEHARALVPVDTGALQDSAHVEVAVSSGGFLIAHVTFSTEYAVYVEFGTSDTPTFAMLRRGAESAGYRLSGG